MTDYERFIQQLKRHEGFRRTPYQCSAGTWTIGYGHTTYVDPEMNVSPEWAGLVLEHVDVPRALHDTDDLCWEQGRVYVVGARYLALVNMCFNLGKLGLDRFEKMWIALRHEDYARAADEMFNSKWAKQVGDRAVELAEQMRTGKWGTVAEMETVGGE